MAKMHSIEKFLVNSRLDYLFHKFFGINRLLQKMIVAEPKNILELGSGIGYTTELIRERFPAASLAAIDYDESQVEIAKKRLANRSVSIAQGDVAQLPFHENNFDACFASFLFHHIPNYHDALKEIYRVLKPHGYLYIVEVPLKLLNQIFSKHQLIQEFEQIGFKVVRSKGKFLLTFLVCEKILP